MSTVLRQQAAFFVRAAGTAYLATWTRYEHDSELRSELIVWRVARTLLPRDGITHGAVDRVQGLSLDACPAYFAARGYELVSALHGPSVEAPLEY